MARERSSGLEPERRAWLQERFEAYARAQPDLRRLHERLLALGGEALVPLHEPDLDAILARGEPFGPTQVILEGRPSQCHENVARLPAEDYRIVTGWALSADDGLWRQHSWALDAAGRVVETTEPRAAYFGYVLSPGEAATFRLTNA